MKCALLTLVCSGNKCTISVCMMTRWLCDWLYSDCIWDYVELCMYLTVAVYCSVAIHLLPAHTSAGSMFVSVVGKIVFKSQLCPETSV